MKNTSVASQRAPKKNLTLRVRTEALRAARSVAAQEGVSLSELFERLTEERLGRAAVREAAKRELLAIADRGIPLGRAPYLTRDRAHER